MAVLPTPGSPMSTGLFLVRRRQHLDGAADFLVAADDRVELAVAHGLGEVAGIFLRAHRTATRPKRSRRCGPCGSLSIAWLSALGGDAGRAQDLARIGVLLDGQREQQALDGDERCRRPSAPRFGRVENARQFAAEIELRSVAADTCGILLRAASTPARTALLSPPARSIRPEPRPWSSSISTLSR